MLIEVGNAALVEAYLRSHSEQVEVADLAVQQAEDIDFFFLNKNSERKSVEVKYDQQGHETGNFAFETISNELTPTRGCFLRTTADWFFYYLVATGDLYIMETESTRQWFLDHIQQGRSPALRHYTTLSYDRHGRVFPSRGWLVPISLLNEQGLIVKRVRLKTEGLEG